MLHRCPLSHQLSKDKRGRFRWSNRSGPGRSPALILYVLSHGVTRSSRQITCHYQK
jgi:hypothetical protein